ncbi:hypothetical protein D3C84_897360 [compost metagenome]
MVIGSLRAQSKPLRTRTDQVVQVPLGNAVSVASVLLLTEATLTEIPEKEGPAEAPYPA